MRIGNVIIDTDNMNSTELATIIHELRTIRARKLKEETLLNGLKELLHEAASEGFFFTTDTNILRVDGVHIWEEAEKH